MNMFVQVHLRFRTFVNFVFCLNEYPFAVNEQQKVWLQFATATPFCKKVNFNYATHNRKIIRLPTNSFSSPRPYISCVLTSLVTMHTLNVSGCKNKTLIPLREIREKPYSQTIAMLQTLQG